jgi:hypothetical protein
MALAAFSCLVVSASGIYVAYALLRCANAIDRCEEQLKRIAQRATARVIDAR